MFNFFLISSHFIEVCCRKLEVPWTIFDGREQRNCSEERLQQVNPEEILLV